MADLDLKVQLSLQDKATKDLKRFNAELAKTQRMLTEVSKMKATIDMGSSGGTRPSGGASTSGGALAGAGALIGGSSVTAGAAALIAGIAPLTKLINIFGAASLASSQHLQFMGTALGAVIERMTKGMTVTRAISSSTDELSHLYDFLAASTDKTATEVAKLTAEYKKNALASDSTSSSVKKHAKSIKAVDDATDNTTTKTKKHFVMVERSLLTYIKWAGAIAIVAGGFKLLSSAIRVGSEYEQLRAQLQGVITDAENVGESFDFIKGVSSQLPTTIAQTTAAFIKMRALGIIPTEERMLAFGNIAATFGANILDVAESAARATVFEFERLEAFGIKYKQAGDTVIFTFQNVTTEVKKNSKDIVGYLEDIGKNNLVGAAALQMDTLVGKTTNLADAWDEFSDSIAQSGLNDLIKSLVVGMTSLIKQSGSVLAFLRILTVKAIGMFSNLASKITHMVGGAWPIIAAGFSDMLNSMSEMMATWVNGFASVFNSIAEMLHLDFNIEYEPVIIATSELDKVTQQLSKTLRDEIATNDAVTQSAVKYWESQLLVTKSTTAYNNQLKELEKAQNDKVKADEAAKIAQEALNKAMADGKDITKEVRTNIEVYKDAIVVLERFLKLGAISQETFNRALQQAKDDASGGLFDETRTDIENTNSYFDNLQDLLSNGIINWDTYGRAVESRLDEMNDKSQDTAISMQEVFMDAAWAMEDGFSDFFFDIMQGNMTDLVGNFKKTLDRMVADMLASQVAGALFGNYNQSGSIGGLAGKAGTFLSGLLKREGGGFVPAGTPTLVGEKRPEIIVPSTDSYVYPSTDAFNSAQSGGGSDSYSITVNALDSKSFRDMVEQDERWFVDTLSGTSRRLNKGGA